MKKNNLSISKYKNINSFFLLVFFLMSFHDLYFVQYGRVFDLVGLFIFVTPIKKEIKPIVERLNGVSILVRS